MEIAAARERIAGIISRYYPPQHQEDMIQTAMIEFSEGATVYQAIAKARREQRKFSRPSRLYGEMTYNNIDLAALRAGVEEHIDHIPDKKAMQNERREICRAMLMTILYSPLHHIATITGKSPQNLCRWKNQIREMLELPDSAGRHGRGPVMVK